MRFIVYALAAYGALRIVADIAGMWYLRRLRQQDLKEEEVARKKMDSFERRHKRIKELLSRVSELLNSRISDGPEVEKVDIELLTLLDEELEQNGSDDFYQRWRDEIIRKYSAQRGQ